MKLSEIQAAGVMPVNAIAPLTAVIQLTDGQAQLLDEGKFNFIEYNGAHYSVKPRVEVEPGSQLAEIERIEVER